MVSFIVLLTSVITIPSLVIVTPSSSATFKAVQGNNDALKAKHSDWKLIEIEKVFAEKLPARYVKRAPAVARTLARLSERYQWDPFFLLALIETESQFHPDLIGKVGEIGLMQVRPSTSDWLCKKMRLNKKRGLNLFDPVVNLEMGVRYLTYLRDRFGDRPVWFTAAYNQGVGRVLRKTALAQNRAPGSFRHSYFDKISQKYLNLQLNRSTAL